MGARTHGMQQVAICNGFTLKKSEQRCGLCGAIGHLGFECPEVEESTYKMANVVIAGPENARRRAKLHVRAWLDAQMAKAFGKAPMPAFPPGGFPPAGFPPA